MSKHSYLHKRYDETIMQTRTVLNIVEALENGIKYKNLKQIAEFLIEKRELSLNKADKRKANSLDRKIARLKELGYVMKTEGNNGI